MRLKKHPNRNEYLLTEDKIWVRNFCKKSSSFIDINDITSNDKHILLENELKNSRLSIPFINIKKFFHPNVLIVSDGFDFDNKQNLLADLNKDVTIIGVNRSLAAWKLVGDKAPRKRAMGYYLTNNPYPEASKFLPKTHRYYPHCIASIRTNTNFIENYKGQTYLYVPTPDENYESPVEYYDRKIDDYRNPICAAISLAYTFQAKKILLYCCDDSFKESRPGSMQLENGLYCYPQHLISKNIVDAMFYWLKQAEIKIGDCSSGGNYTNIPYIPETEVLNFFGNN